jgi:ABC-2 type transport system permease protein
MNRFLVVLRKELVESWRTRRLPAVLIMFITIGLLAPLTAKYLPEIIKAALGDEISVPLPVPTAADAVLQLQKNLGQLGAFAAIVLAMNAVAGEKEHGTAAFVLTKPVRRGAFIGAKLVALGLVIGLAVVAAIMVAWVYTAVLFQPLPIAGWLALGVLSWLALSVWASITFFASTVTGSAAAAAGVGIVALIVLSLVSAVPQVARFLPPALDGPALALATGNTADLAVDTLTTAIGGSVGLLVASAVGAWLAFRHQEL